MSRASCRGCIYYRHLSAAAGGKGCHYMLDTGKKRDCSADNCDKRLTAVQNRLIQRDKLKKIKLYSRPNKLLRSAMKGSKTTGKKLSGFLGITQVTFSRKLNRALVQGYVAKFTPEEKAKIAKALNIPSTMIE